MTENLLSYLTVGFALIFVIEGLLYAIFPRHIQKMMEMASLMPADKFRSLGALLMCVGVLMIWLLLRF